MVKRREHETYRHISRDQKGGLNHDNTIFAFPYYCCVHHSCAAQIVTYLFHLHEGQAAVHGKLNWISSYLHFLPQHSALTERSQWLRVVPILALSWIRRPWSPVSEGHSGPASDFRLFLLFSWAVYGESQMLGGGNAAMQEEPGSARALISPPHTFTHIFLWGLDLSFVRMMIPLDVFIKQDYAPHIMKQHQNRGDCRQGNRNKCSEAYSTFQDLIWPN